MASNIGTFRHTIGVSHLLTTVAVCARLSFVSSCSFLAALALSKRTHHFFVCRLGLSCVMPVVQRSCLVAVVPWAHSLALTLSTSGAKSEAKARQWRIHWQTLAPDHREVTAIALVGWSKVHGKILQREKSRYGGGGVPGLKGKDTSTPENSWQIRSREA